MLWDSHPLALGATPQQVWIDGIPQLSSPQTLVKPRAAQHVPPVPNFDREMAEALAHDGLPPLEPRLRITGTVVFANVSSVYVRSPDGMGVERLFPTREDEKATPGETKAWAIAHAGRITCVGSHGSACLSRALRLASAGNANVVDLEGGALSPGLTTYGSELGLDEIFSPKEVMAKDGIAPDGLRSSVPWLAGGTGGLIRAADGLMFGTRNALYVLDY